MEHYKEVTVTRKELVKRTCDICGKEINDNDRSEINVENEVTIEHEISESSYGEFIGGKILLLDICPDCFENKILPFLRSIGLKRDYTKI